MTPEEGTDLWQRLTHPACGECRAAVPRASLVTHPLTGLRICGPCALRTVPAGYIPKEYAEELQRAWDEAFVGPDVTAGDKR